MRRRNRLSRLLENLRRSFGEFLTIPIALVVAFVVLAVLVYELDATAGEALDSVRWWRLLGNYVGDAKAATGLLSTIAGSLITVTSITFSILLLAVQQGASALTSQIVDHYLRRRSNQLYFGFFVGVSLFALVTLALTTSASRPVLGVTLSTVFAAFSLFALLLLIYSTIDQIRPVTVIAEIHDVALRARDAQRGWLTSASGTAPEDARWEITSASNGYLTRVRFAMLEATLREAGLRVAIRVRIGDYVAAGVAIAAVTGAERPDDRLRDRIRRALPIETRRDVGCDPAFGLDQLTTIAWTSISTAKSNPTAAAIACNALGDVLRRLAAERPDAAVSSPVSYTDGVVEALMDDLESLVVVASESMQHQSLAILMDALDGAYDAMAAPLRDRAAAILTTSLSALGDHVPTRRLGESFARVVATLRRDGREEVAWSLDEAWRRLAASRGTLHARGDRGTDG